MYSSFPQCIYTRKTFPYIAISIKIQSSTETWLNVGNVLRSLVTAKSLPRPTSWHQSYAPICPCQCLCVCMSCMHKSICLSQHQWQKQKIVIESAKCIFNIFMYTLPIRVVARTHSGVSGVAKSLSSIHYRPSEHAFCMQIKRLSAWSPLRCVYATEAQNMGT